MPIGQMDERFLELLKKGDPNATHSIGSRIKKANHPEKGHHMPGTLGTVVGNCYHPALGDAYLVHFDGDADHIETFITGEKIEKA